MATLRELPPWACDLIGFNRAEGVSSDIAAGADTLDMNDLGPSGGHSPGHQN